MTRTGAVARVWLLAIGLMLGLQAAAAQQTTRTHALAHFATPRYGADFAHFDYADPSAPRGGTLRLAWPGSFDTVNPLPLAGAPLRSSLLMLDPLMWPSQDELAVFYPLIAEGVEYPEDLSWVIFHLNPEARWHDGVPVTADDVVWTFEQIQAHGRPFLQAQYLVVTGARALDDHRVRFDLETRGAMRPLLRLAGLQPMPRHWWTSGDRDISRGTVDPILGNGPYRLTQVRRGLRLRYERVEDYWAADLPSRVGHFNFEAVDYQFFRDRDVMFEAFRAGEADFRHEFTSRLWATAYDIAAVRDGLLRREAVPVHNYRGLQGYFFNTRLPMFADRRVREALSLLYPFEFVNRRLMYGSYQRQDSYFAGAEDWRATGLPQGRELELLQPFRGQVPEEVFTQVFAPPANSEQGVTRDNLRRALALLAEAGWTVRDGTMVNTATGAPLRFEIMLLSSSLEPHTLAFTDALERIGVAATIRLIEVSEFTRRYQNREFQVISFAATFDPPPGSELASFFGSAAAVQNGTPNIAGIAEPAIDAMIDAAIGADTLEALQAATRALDRLLVWGHYAVPHWYKTDAWIAYWDRFGRPASDPPFDFGFPNTIHFQPTWWIDPARDAALAAAR